jgi:hypothetical protein
MFLHVDGKIPESSTGALRFLRGSTTTFAGPDIGIGAIPLVATAIIKRLAGGGRDSSYLPESNGETFGTVEWAVPRHSAIPTAGTINATHQCSRSDDNTSASEGITGTFFILRLGTNRVSVAPDCAKITEVDARAPRLDSATDLPTCSSKKVLDK